MGENPALRAAGMTLPLMYQCVVRHRLVFDVRHFTGQLALYTICSVGYFRYVQRKRQQLFLTIKHLSSADGNGAGGNGGDLAGACVDGGYIGVGGRPLERLADVAAVVGNGHELKRTEGLGFARGEIPFRCSRDGVAEVIVPPNA